jgi:hypothetical protein
MIFSMGRAPDSTGLKTSSKIALYRLLESAMGNHHTAKHYTENGKTK